MQLPIRINIKPKPTPRPRVKTIYKNGKGINCTYYPPEYQSYKDELCLILKKLRIESKDYTTLHVTFGIPYPITVKGGKKARIEGNPHFQKPDLDNIIKGFKDGLTQSKTLLTDDSTICFLHASKLWTNSEGYIYFLLEI
jgi:Holliday junction resolvase RusA-like endonuclease